MSGLNNIYRYMNSLAESDIGVCQLSDLNFKFDTNNTNKTTGEITKGFSEVVESNGYSARVVDEGDEYVVLHLSVDRSIL